MLRSPAGAAFSSKNAVYILVPLLVLVTIILYVPNLGSSFVDWDLVAYRKVLSSGDYWNVTKQLFTDWRGEIVSGYYAPLGSISLMLDKALFGKPCPWLTLFINLILHCANGILVFLLVRKLGADQALAFIAALIFLIHPLQVSSVVWFAQRKGLLGGLFFLGAYLTYVRYVQERGRGVYVCSAVLFAAALLTKPTVTVLPVLLWFTHLLLWPPRGNARVSDPSTGHLPLPSGDAWSRLQEACRVAMRTLWPVLPFFLLALAISLLIVQSERTSMERAALNIPIGIAERPFIAAATVCFYLSKAFAPLGLSPIYPRWEVDPCSTVWWLPLIACLAAGTFMALYRKRLGALPRVAAILFLVPLLPSSGLFTFGYLRLSFVADHFLYLPMIGISLGFAIIIQGIRARLSGRLRQTFTVAAAGWICFLAFQTVNYACEWRNSVSLWTYNLKHNPSSWTAHTYLGHAFMGIGKPKEAIAPFLTAVNLKEWYIKERLARASEREQSGDRRRAQRDRKDAERVYRTLAVSYHNLGTALLRSGMPNAALTNFLTAVQLQPPVRDLMKSLTNLGATYLLLGQPGEAVQHLRKVVTVNPNHYEALYNLGTALIAMGRNEEGEEYLARARRIRPDSVVTAPPR